MSRLLPLLVALCMIAPSSAAAEDAEKVAIVAIVIGGDAAAQLQAQMDASIMRGIETAGHVGAPIERVRKAIKKQAELIGCTSTTCLNRIGELVEATLFISANVESRGATYNYELTLHDLESEDGVRRRAKRSCEVCTITELSDMIAESTVELLSSSDDAPVAIQIVSRPEGATLRIGDRDVGAAPFAGELPPGMYTVTASLDGYADAEITVEVSPAGDQRFEIPLTKTDSIEPPKHSGPEPKYSTLKYVAAGGGLVSFIGGVVLLSMHGDGTCTLEPPDAQCPDEYNTLLGGLGAASLGVGLGALSTWMFLQDAKVKRRGTEAALLPTRGGAMATVRLSF